jgi:hypothetical protein
VADDNQLTTELEFDRSASGCPEQAEIKLTPRPPYSIFSPLHLVLIDYVGLGAYSG